MGQSLEAALDRALSRFQLSTGAGLAISPTIITVLATHGEAALWLSLTVATLLAAWSVRRLSEGEQHARSAGRRERQQRFQHS